VKPELPKTEARKKLTPSEQLAHSTVRIECDTTAGARSTGTGFFYSLNRNESEHVPVIITNKHVIAGASTGRFHMTLAKEDGSPNVGTHRSFSIEAFERQWFPHPDEKVDLCAMPIAPLLKAIQAENMRPFFVSLDKSIIPSTSDIESMIGLEGITMVGYPNGLWDATNNLPLFRKGNLATDYRYDWNGAPEFLIDAACFPGSSGSPVMLFDIGSYQDRNGNVFGGSRIRLLGVLYAGPVHTITGEVRVVEVPTNQAPVAVAGIPNNLGVVIKASQLLAFEGVFS
jgi:hypothetical protein